MTERRRTRITVDLIEEDDGTQTVEVGFTEDLKTAAVVGALHMAADAVMNPRS